MTRCETARTAAEGDHWLPTYRTVYGDDGDTVLAKVASCDDLTAGAANHLTQLLAWYLTGRLDTVLQHPHAAGWELTRAAQALLRTDPARCGVPLPELRATVDASGAVTVLRQRAGSAVGVSRRYAASALLHTRLRAGPVDDPAEATTLDQMRAGIPSEPHELSADTQTQLDLIETRFGRFGTGDARLLVAVDPTGALPDGSNLAWLLCHVDGQPATRRLYTVATDPDNAAYHVQLLGGSAAVLTDDRPQVLAVTERLWVDAEHGSPLQQLTAAHRAAGLLHRP